MLPLLYRKDAETIVCKDGALVSVLKIRGRDYTGMNEDEYISLFQARKIALGKRRDFLTIDIVSKKQKVQAQLNLAQSNNQILAMINGSWQKNFDTVFRTSHYIIITVRELSKTEKLAAKLDDAYRIDLNTELHNAKNELINELTQYEPIKLKNGALNSFFSTLINGRETQTNSEILCDPTFNHCIANQSLFFDTKKSHVIYGKNSEAIYSGWLSIANYPDELNQKTLEQIFTLPYEFNVYQSFTGYSEKRFNTFIENKQTQIQNWGKHTEQQLKNLEDLASKVENGELILTDHYFCLEVLAPDEDTLNEHIGIIKTKLQIGGALYFRESDNMEALFWSRFPTKKKFNVRHAPITSENGAFYSTFNSIGEGFDTCRFGNRPVTMFKTKANSQFSFTFHDKPDLTGEPLGHTAIFGGTNSGKTTLITFLVAQCLPYQGFKAILFDRLLGMEVFSRIMDGDYLDFGKNVQINPLQISDNVSNRTFLKGWLCRLLRISENETKHKNTIDTVVDTNFMIDMHERSLTALKDVFGGEGSELRNRLSEWLPDGGFGGYFNGSRDSLSFDNSIVAFDATNITSMPEILPHMTDYLFNRIFAKLTTETVPNVIVMDEAQRYFTDPEFVKRAMEFSNELRKLLGVFCPIFQNASAMAKLPNGAGTTIKDAMANYIIFPNPTADEEHYCDFLGLNKTEFEWVKSNSPSSRKVLFKRRESGESVVLDIDLSKLNNAHFDLLKAFQSGGTSRKHMHECMETYGDDWKLKYLSQ